MYFNSHKNTNNPNELGYKHMNLYSRRELFMIILSVQDKFTFPSPTKKNPKPYYTIFLSNQGDLQLKIQHVLVNSAWTRPL